MHRAFRWTLSALTVLAAVSVVTQIVGWREADAAPIPSDAEIRSILMDRVDKYRQSMGIVVGGIEPQGRRVISYGELNQGDPEFSMGGIPRGCPRPRR